MKVGTSKHDRELIFDTYLQANSYLHAAKILKEKYNVTGISDKPMSYGNISYLVRRFEIEEPEIARKKWIEYGKHEFKIDSIWDKRLIRNILFVFKNSDKSSHRSLIRYLLKLDLYDKAIEWGILHPDFAENRLVRINNVR